MSSIIRHRCGRAIRHAGTGLALLATAWWFGAAALGLRAHPERLTFSGWLEFVSAAAVSIGCSWLLATWTAATLALLPGALGSGAARAAARLAPAVLRRSLTLTLTIGALAPAAHASPAASVAAHATSATGREGAPSWLAEAPPELPDPALRSPHAPPAPPRATAGSASATPPAPADATHVVRAGDTLWGLAQARLGPTATDSRVAVEWPRWFAANRHLLDDPDQLRPGQVLHCPSPRTDTP